MPLMSLACNWTTLDLLNIDLQDGFEIYLIRMILTQNLKSFPVIIRVSDPMVGEVAFPRISSSCQLHFIRMTKSTSEMQHTTSDTNNDIYQGIYVSDSIACETPIRVPNRKTNMSAKVWASNVVLNGNLVTPSSECQDGTNV